MIMFVLSQWTETCLLYLFLVGIGIILSTCVRSFQAGGRGNLQNAMLSSCRPGQVPQAWGKLCGVMLFIFKKTVLCVANFKMNAILQHSFQLLYYGNIENSLFNKMTHCGSDVMLKFWNTLSYYNKMPRLVEFAVSAWKQKTKSRLQQSNPAQLRLTGLYTCFLPGSHSFRGAQTTPNLAVIMVTNVATWRLKWEKDIYCVQT